ncbi:hypothetical protein [Flavobacterium sp.]|uniref:hypothetical protein n=1 Tax=Flavobacterium sp. TaxID=239 RepID=UPI003266F183
MINLDNVYVSFEDDDNDPTYTDAASCKLVVHTITDTENPAAVSDMKWNVVPRNIEDIQMLCRLMGWKYDLATGIIQTVKL